MPTAVYAATEDWGTAPDPTEDPLALRITRATAELTPYLTAGLSPRPAPQEETFTPFAQQLAALAPDT